MLRIWESSTILKKVDPIPLKYNKSIQAIVLDKHETLTVGWKIIKLLTDSKFEIEMKEDGLWLKNDIGPSKINLEDSKTSDS